MVFYCPFAISYLVKKKPRSRKYTEILSIINSYYWLEFQVCYQEFFSATSLNGNEGLRPRPHVSGNLWKRKFFFTNTACVHTYPAYFLSVSGNFWKRSPEWKFFYPIRIRIRVDSRIRKFANTLTSFSWVQSSRWAL